MKSITVWRSVRTHAPYDIHDVLCCYSMGFERAGARFFPNQCFARGTMSDC